MRDVFSYSENPNPFNEAETKDLIEAMRERPIDGSVLEETAQRIARQRTTEEAKGGIGAFLDKRPAPWLPEAS